MGFYEDPYRVRQLTYEMWRATGVVDTGMHCWAGPQQAIDYTENAGKASTTHRGGGPLHRWPGQALPQDRRENPRAAARAAREIGPASTSERSTTGCSRRRAAAGSLKGS